ncbi:response regulator [Limnoraphis robusta]|uniref:Response regulator n=1 Tax=Limnoraphis robusta CCNP1315 TaxID=3110306 RepID=A0ABU5TY66_9CYAN|nr:response regulator [Limnoraphis robusta]MEA5519887.1 response regulator [Limnoraphis robusta CCNP1315]MEA5547794.1 response regulator [Limnoraphis robusta CCNP1324]
MKKSPIKILLVEDDSLLSEALTKVLEANYYIVELASDGEAGLSLATQVEYDLILLDVQLPKQDGISVVRELRGQGYSKPILLLTAKNSDTDIIAGFDAGADDYISKPYQPDVLLARMRTLLRRSGAILTQNSHENPSDILTWGKLCLDLHSGRVTFNDQVISLTATEYNLLKLFLGNPERIFSRNAILDRLWGFDNAPTDRAIITHVKDVRKKLKTGGLTEEIIETIYGMGYRLKPRPIPVSSDDNTSEHHSPQNKQLNLDKLLERFRGMFNERVAVLEQAKIAFLAGNLETELHQTAQQEAHKLAGSMASFGYPEASKIARTLEHFLRNNPPFTPEEITQFSQGVTALKQEWAKPPMPAKASLVEMVSNSQVLVIDDDLALTEQLKSESKALNLNINIAPNCSTARSYLTRSTPDVILLDLSFPTTEEDGLILLRELTEKLPNLPIIVFTGRDSLADRLAVSRLGAKQFLHKPATPEQIFQAITRVLNKTQPLSAKVLIVDDDPVILTHLSTILTPWGLEVIPLNEPQHFWEKLLITSPDLILLDLEMPEVSGLELCQVVRQDTQWGDLPILVVTACTDADSLQQAFSAGADDFITKPILGPELVARVLSRIERDRKR